MRLLVNIARTHTKLTPGLKKARSYNEVNNTNVLIQPVRNTTSKKKTCPSCRKKMNRHEDEDGLAASPSQAGQPFTCL